ncbi:MAG: hypothetical protein KC729_17035, partial [Candidatus Eisenbacteria bacterium]|nr:hypothetical protein [Candidatus Eisenbacteria bacterium]
MSRLRTLAAIPLVVTLCNATASAQTLGGWSSAFWRTGVQPDDATIRQLLVYQNQLLAVGSFAGLSRAETNGIARWDGTGWLPFGATGCSEGGAIYAAVEFEGDLVVAGRFSSMDSTPAASVARWTGSDWQPLGDGFNDDVDALHVHAGELFAGGKFTLSGSTPTARLAKWNGTSWEQYAEVSATVNVITTYGTNVAIGGTFTIVNGGAASRLAVELAPGIWTDFLGGVNSTVNALVEAEGRLVVGGSFSLAGGVPVVRAAGWDGLTWQPMDLDANGSALGLQVADGVLYATGSFHGGGKLYVVKWEDSAWRALDDLVAPNGWCWSAVSWQGKLHVGGQFRAVGSDIVRGFARFDGVTWEAPEPPHGFEGTVWALEPHEGHLAIGGDITAIHGEAFPGVALWDSGTFLPLGDGLNGRVRALASTPLGLVAGGDFTASGTRPIPRVALWDGTEWQALGAGLDHTVTCLAWYDGAVHAGGYFEVGPSEAHVARWNGTEWESLGVGPRGILTAMGSYEGMLVVGGDFVFAGPSLASHVAAWTGTSWEGMGHGLPEPATCFQALGPVLAAGATNGGGFRAWNGVDWLEDPPLPGVTTVYSLGTFGGEFVAGTYSGVFVLRDGAWAPWPEAVTRGGVRAFAEFDGALWTGGDFQFAGPHSSASFGRWRDPLPLTRVQDVANQDRSNPLPEGLGVTYVVGSELLLRTSSERADIYDVRGRRVGTVSLLPVDESTRSFLWDGRNTGGSAVSSGIYFLR